jgi:hypothetical protein
MGGLQEAAAQHFDELLTSGKAETENVSKMSANSTKYAGEYPKSSIGADGFEPSTT